MVINKVILCLSLDFKDYKQIDRISKFHKETPVLESLFNKVAFQKTIPYFSQHTLISGMFRALANIYDEVFHQSSYRFKVVNYFRKKAPL